MRNEPNFRNAENERNPLCDKLLWKKIAFIDAGKTNPNKPNLVRLRRIQKAGGSKLFRRVF